MVSGKINSSTDDTQAVAHGMNLALRRRTRIRYTIQTRRCPDKAVLSRPSSTHSPRGCGTTTRSSPWRDVPQGRLAMLAAPPRMRISADSEHRRKAGFLA